jgi:hypothetical protein
MGHARTHRIAPCKASTVLRRSTADHTTKPCHGMAANGSMLRQPDPRDDARQYGSMLSSILAVQLIYLAKTMEERINDIELKTARVPARPMTARNAVDFDMR